MKHSAHTQYITLSIMVAVLFLLVSLLPSQTGNNGTNQEQPDKTTTEVGLVTGKKDLRDN